MSDEQPGLRPRLAHVARRLAGQHDHLDALVATTRRALAGAAPAEAREALHAFRGALDAHFALEEQVHFPALRALDAGLGPEIDALVSGHHALRDRMLALEGRAAREPADRIAEDFEDFAAVLRAHESREERLFDRSGLPPA
ncbi:MAG TPA: hemerythrin domain-containing protein [Myxococcota bacterium]